MPALTSLSDQTTAFPFRKYFVAIVTDYGSPHDAMVNNQFTTLPTPNLDEVLSIYKAHLQNTNQGVIAQIEETYAFIWDGLKLELNGCSLAELRFFDEELSTLKALKAQYENGYLALYIRHGDRWTEIKDPKERRAKDEDQDGTDNLQCSKTMQYAAWLIGEATSFVERRLGYHNTANPESNEDQPFIPVPDPVVPILLIRSSAREGLYNALARFVDVTQHTDLRAILNGETAATPVVIRHKQGSIAYVFRQAQKAGHCDEEKTGIRNWLLYWFRVYDGKEVRSMTPNTVYDSLSKDKHPSKSNRIPYNP